MKGIVIGLGLITTAGVLGVARAGDAARIAVPSIADTVPATQGDSLVALIRANARKPEGETYLAQLDTLSSATPVQRFQGRRYLLSYYLNYDIDDKMVPTATRMLELAKGFTPDEQAQLANSIFTAYRTLATVHANRLEFDQALAVLRKGPEELATVPGVEKAFQRDVKRYEMIGKAAPVLTADKWFSSEAKPFAGNVTLLVFTANWCHSCRSSYPTVVKLDSTLKDKGLQTVLAVTLDGAFEGVDMTPEQEFEANRKYFLERNGFSFPLSVQNRVDDDAPDSLKAKLNREAYALGGYPQFVVIDRQGIIRAILLGWDPYGNREQSLTNALERVIGS